MKRLLILASVLTLTACTAVTESPTPTASPSPVATTTITSSPTVTLSITPSPIITSTATASQNVTPSLTPIFPGADADHIPLDDIFLAGFTDDCEFPCWYGLQINESNPEDVQRLFDDVFGFDGSLNFWAPHEGPALTDAVFFYTFPGLTSTGYVWHDHITLDQVGIVAYLSESTDRYQGLAVVWVGGPTSNVFADFVLSDIFQKLGTPSNILISGPTRDHGSSILIIYDQGFVFHIPASSNQVTEHASIIYCLGDTKFHEYSSFPGTMVITPPLEDRLDNLSEFEEFYFGGEIKRNRLQPLNEVSDTTVEQLVQAILNGEDACIEVAIVE